MQNKLLKLLLKWDRRTPTDLVHQRLSILKIDDVHNAKVLSFVNESRSCRVPEMFVNYYKIWEAGLNLRNRSSLDIPWARTDLGLSRYDIKGGRLWNNYLHTTSQFLYKNSFHKQFSKFLTRKYNWFKISLVRLWSYLWPNWILCIWELCRLSTYLPCEVLLPYSHLQTATIWLPARWAPGFPGYHHQMQPCLCRLILYIVIHVSCNTLFVLC